MRHLAQASDVQLHIGESILTIVVMDSGLALRAPLNDDWECGPHLRIPAAGFARVLQDRSALLENRGRREDRVRAAPAVSCANCTKKNAHEHTGSAETLRPSPRNGFTAYNVLSLVTGFLATIAPEKRLLLKGLDASIGASEPHDFAVRVTRRSSKAQSRPPHPTARFVTCARPSCRVRRAKL
jgi:hypothetical protein